MKKDKLTFEQWGGGAWAPSRSPPPPAIRASDEVVLVEGNMDVVASHQAGIKQVVAVSGTALTLDQLKTLSRLTKNVKLAFDQDAAGLAATERAIELAQ